MKKLPTRKGVQIGVAVFIFTGCFSYIPAELGTVPEGDDVRLHLTRQAVAVLPEIPKQSGSMLTGTLVRKDEDQILVRVPIAVQLDGFLTRTLGQEVRIPASHIVQLERREFNRVRTGMALAGGAVAVAVLVASFLESEPQHPDPPPGEEEGRGIRWGRFTIFSIPLR